MQFHQLRRREFITLLGSMAVSWPLAARAQQPERMRRIGVLMGYPESDSEAQANIVAFREGLEKLGWVEDRNIRFDTRWATPEDAEARQGFAKELVALTRPHSVAHYTHHGRAAGRRSHCRRI
jgi:putative tryptophan/tyrosine transport system substrate-binding protein